MSTGAAGAEAGKPLGDWDTKEDPIYQDELWIVSEQVRYSDGASGSAEGIGLKSSFKPFLDAGNHSRGILLLHAGAPSEPELQLLTDRLALSCECVALAPLLRGSLAQWPRERLASAAWEAARYLNGACGAEALAVVAVGDTAVPALALLAEGALGAHAAIALCPGGASNPNDAARVARELDVPLLAVCATADASGAAHAAALRDSLALNSRLASDWYVAEFEREADSGFVLRPQAAADAQATDRAVALVQTWVDAHCPEHMGR